MKDRLNEILNEYKGEFSQLFTEIGSYSFGHELASAKVFYSKKYQIFKIRKWFDTYYKVDHDIDVKNAKDVFYNLEGETIGHSLTGALLHPYVIKFIKKYNIKPDIDIELNKLRGYDKDYFEKNRESLIKNREEEIFSSIKALFVSMITDRSKKAKEKLRKMRTGFYYKN